MDVALRAILSLVLDNVCWGDIKCMQGARCNDKLPEEEAKKHYGNVKIISFSIILNIDVLDFFIFFYEIIIISLIQNDICILIYL